MTARARADVERQIKNLLRGELGVDAAFVAACDASTALLGHGVGLDSIEVLALALSLERAFGIQIPDEDLTVQLFENLGTLTEYVLQKLK